MIIICDNHNLFDILKSVLICDNLWTKKLCGQKKKTSVDKRISYLWTNKISVEYKKAGDEIASLY